MLGRTVFLFSRILTELQNYYQPEWNLDRGGQELVELFKRTKFDEKHFETNVIGSKDSKSS